jgi:hypothetical protein
MKKISRGVYEVAPGEAVTMKFTPVEVGEEFVAVAVDGEALQSSGGTTPTFTFTASTTVGERHFAKIECDFPEDTPETARFDMILSGSNGGSFPRAIENSDPIHDPEFEFRVVSQ